MSFAGLPDGSRYITINYDEQYGSFPKFTTGAAFRTVAQEPSQQRNPLLAIC